MRILFFTLEYAPGLAGGAEHQARLQAQELVRRGHEVAVVCPRSPRLRSGLVDGVQVYRLRRSRRPRLRKPSYAVALAGWLLARGRKYDVWHVHLASRQADWAVLIAGILRRPTYVKVASGGRTGEIRSGERSAWLTGRIGLRRAGRVQALTGEIAAELEQAGVDPDRIVRIPNGLDLSVFHPADRADRGAAREKLGLPSRRLVILYTGRFAEYKGLADLLRAWEDVAPASEALLVLVGARGREDRPLSVQVAGPRVLSRPWTSDVRPYLQSADLFVYPPHQDGMSNALLEAMACGVAPVATRIPAVDGLLEHERNALLIPSSAPGALGEAILRCLRDERLREDIAREAARTAQRYSVQAVVDDVERAYAALKR